MDPAKVKAWQHFRERILYDTSWPRSLWLAAVEDALATALGADSRLLADYRADVAELLRLERAARGSYHDEKRLAELEGEIKRLIELADETISGADAEAVPATAEPRGGRAWSRPAWSWAVGALLFLAGVAGTTAFHGLRLHAEVERQMQLMAGLLDQRVADLRADLDHRLSVAEGLNAQMVKLHDEFSTNADQLSATMADSVRSVTALSDHTVAELERRLAARGSGVTEVLGRLQARADALGRGLDNLSHDLSALEKRLPKLAGQVESVAGNVQRLRAGFDQAAAAIDAVKAGAPELAAWLAQQKGALGQDLDRRKAELDALTTEVKDLEGAVGQSRARLQGFNQSLDQDLERAKQDGAALENAVQDLRATGHQVAQLLAGADAKVEAAHREMQKKIDQILSEVADKADLAVLRSQDVTHRAEGEITRKLQTEGQQALDDLAKAREARLAELAKRASATQVELEQTRAGLVAGWQSLDQAVAERQNQVLTGLDGYAQTIQARVQDLLNALDVKVAGGNG
jgi:predicted  nucleic acid-binding Zn-ribbon protein